MFSLFRYTQSCEWYRIALGHMTHRTVGYEMIVQQKIHFLFISTLDYLSKKKNYHNICTKTRTIGFFYSYHAKDEISFLFYTIND